MRILEGNVVAEGIKIGIVAARFNEFIVSKLVGGAQDACVRHGVKMRISIWHGFRVHLRFRSLQRKWQLPENMMQCFAWVL